MIIKELTVGPIMANCYIVGCEETQKAVIVDPGDEAERILHNLAESNLTAEYIIDTHGHFDHVGANRKVKAATGAGILIHPLDAPLLSQLAARAAAWGLRAEDSPAPDRTMGRGRHWVQCSSRSRPHASIRARRTGERQCPQ